MKKIITTILILLTLLNLSSCVIRFGPTIEALDRIPAGVWRSEEPDIILYFKRSYQAPARARSRPRSYLGIYTVDGEEIKIFTEFYGHHGDIAVLRIYDLNSADVERHAILTSSREWYMLFVGHLNIVEGQLHYTLTPGAQERTGFDVIIFDRVTDYDPINPEDWWPSR